MTDSPWTEERLTRAKELYLEGASAGMIAQELGYTTRNAVIGIIHRRKWRFLDGKLAKPPTIPPRKNRMPAEGQRVPGLWKPKPSVPLPEEPVGGLQPLAEFHTNEFGCTWITGEPTYDAATCGRAKHHDSSYCPAHHRMAWVKPNKFNATNPGYWR